ncbi:hypothetical protein I5J93_17130 [Pseudomonas aeruginosa]|nr:hypothetical protein [Pseudomonas aeruginosa]
MNKANECTCPSGDGSLVHPCPAHPAVEQAGGDERAAFELFVRKHCGMPEHIAVNWDAKFTNDAWEGWQARAALAQPSPKCATCGGTGMVDDGEITCSEGGIPYENGPVKCVKDCPDCKAQHSPAQAEQHWPKLEKPAQVGAIRFRAGLSSRLVVEAAQRLYEFESTPEQEAERPEMSPERAAYFMRRFKSEEKLLGPNEQAAVDYVLSLLAQHERIVGALRAEITQLRQHKNDYMDAGQETYRALQNEIREREAEIARLDGLVSGRTAERDAALARVAALESKLAELEKQEPIGWWAQYCETPMRRMVHWGAKGPECTSEEFHPFYAAPFVKAQHRVPGKYDEVLLPFLKSMEHELHANAGKGDRPGWLQMDRKTALLEIYYHLGKLQKATKGNDTAGIVEYAADVANMSMMLVDVCGLLAAAPGKEGV